MIILLLVLSLFASTAHAAPLAVCATTPDLASLVETVGGPDVAVTVFARGPEDPHHVEAKPSFVKALSQAELLVVSGLDLEIGWLPPLLQGARNAAVQPGSRGYFDASTAIAPLEVPTATIDRSMGDVHPFGNPHYLTDPVNGLRVAAAIRDRLVELRPDAKAGLDERYDAFRRRLGAALVGDALAQKYEFEKLATLSEYGKLDAFLQSQGDAGALGGWLGAMAPHRGAKAVDDHNVWPYFVRRFGLVVVGHMEPRPGIPPTTRQLADLVARMRADGVQLILASAYYDPRHARLLAEQTGASIASMANQVGAQPGTATYVDMIDYDVRQVLAALGGRR